MITDDPGTPGNRKWEINVAYNREQNQRLTISEAPLLDLNYGLGDRIQLKFEIPWLMQNSQSSPFAQGIGDGDFGVKWRFFEKGPHELAISMYPQYTFNTSRDSENKELVESDASLFLPLEATFNLGFFDINAEVGFNFHRSFQNELVYGLVVGHTFAKDVDVDLEYRSNEEMLGFPRESFVNLGFRFPLSSTRTLMFSYGRGLEPGRLDFPQYIAYLGVQFRF